MPMAEQAMLPPELLDRLRRTNRGDVLESDLATLGFLASLSTQQWESVDLSTYAGKLTREDMEKFVAVKGKAMADLQNARNNPSPDMTVTTMIGTLADRAGLSGAAQKDARGNFTLAMISYVEAYRLENDGKAPSSEDLAAEADRLRLKVVTEEGIVYNTKKTVDEVLLSPPALVDDAGQPVPKADVQAFIRGVVAIQGEAAILTPEALQQLYLNYLANQ
jgi:hypothetical protein